MEIHDHPVSEDGGGDSDSSVQTVASSSASSVASAAGSGEVRVGEPVAVIVEDSDAYAAFAKADAAGEVALDAGVESFPRNEMSTKIKFAFPVSM